MLALRNIMLAGKKSEPIPYDYEVEYIERDFGILWDNEDTSDWGGYDISEYFPTTGGFQTLAATIESEFSTQAFSAATSSSYYASVYLFGRDGGMFQKLRGHGAYVAQTQDRAQYLFRTGVVGSITTSTYGQLNVFHKMKSVYDGSGYEDAYFDGTLLKTVATYHTGKLGLEAYLLRQGTSVLTDIKIRLKSFKYNDTVDMIPVVKGEEIGFYNKVDGKLFLEKRDCLSAGPRV